MFALEDKIKELSDGMYSVIDSGRIYGFDKTFIVINNRFYQYKLE